MTDTPEPDGWWCALCAAVLQPSWLGRGDAIAYHNFGEPPFVARHALTPAGAVTVTLCEDGPLLLRGSFELVTRHGEVVDPGRRTVALCRCGASAVKPFCDGTHKSIGFQAPSAPASERPLTAG